MQLQELIEFIDWTLSEAGKGTFYRDQDMTKRIFAQSMKVAEEVGELQSEILGHTGFVRQEKLARYTPETLSDEFADVILSTIRLSRFLNVDLQKALEQKMEKLRGRADVR